MGESAEDIQFAEECLRGLLSRSRSALIRVLAELPQSAEVAVLSDTALHRALVASSLYVVVSAAAVRSLGVGALAELRKSRLFKQTLPVLMLLLTEQGDCIEGPPEATAFGAVLIQALTCNEEGAPIPFERLPPQFFGVFFERLLQDRVMQGDGGRRRFLPDPSRKQNGRFFTPAALTHKVVLQVFMHMKHRFGGENGKWVQRLKGLTVCDPACGAGAFLLEMGSQLAAELEAVGAHVTRREIVDRCLHGVDLDPLVVAVAEASLWLFAGGGPLPLGQEGRAALQPGDALCGPPGRECVESEGALDFLRTFPAVFERGGFDLIVGNPPWVAYAGRAAKPLAGKQRAYFASRYLAFKGYPTLHGMFVERALELAPEGLIALLLPSPIADLVGYRHVRRAVSVRHRVIEPLVEFGQDAFTEVTQPCFALIAEPRTVDFEPEVSSLAPSWRLAERQLQRGAALELDVPEVLSRLRASAPLPREIFGEMGFQSNSAVSRDLMLKSAHPQAAFTVPLLQGRDVTEFRVQTARLFLNPDPVLLKGAGCRMRGPEQYTRVKFVVRQTAKVPIAALCSGLPFRNSLLAGFEHGVFTAALVVGLLNSALYRALHLSACRDARQVAFPQVKVGHLRALPRPPENSTIYSQIAELTETVTAAGVVDVGARARLDNLVFELFGITAEEQMQVLAFLAQQAPRLGHRPLP